MVHNRHSVFIVGFRTEDKPRTREVMKEVELPCKDQLVPPPPSLCS